MQILISDDDPSLRQYVSTKLRDLGQIHEACDGSDTLAKLRQHAIDLLLLDWTMPVLSGLDVLKLIRAHGLQLPVIMVTAESAKQRVLAALEAGASDYLIKPFESSALRAKVKKFLPPAAAAHATAEPIPQGRKARLEPTSWKVAER